MMPVVDAMQIYPHREQIRITGQAKSGHVATVAAAPQPDACRVDVWPALQEVGGCEQVVVFRGSISADAGSLAELQTVTDATAVIQRKHDVASTRKVLVHCVGVAVVIHVVPPH